MLGDDCGIEEDSRGHCLRVNMMSLKKEVKDLGMQVLFNFHIFDSGQLVSGGIWYFGTERRRRVFEVPYSEGLEMGCREAACEVCYCSTPEKQSANAILNGCLSDLN